MIPWLIAHDREAFPTMCLEETNKNHAVTIATMFVIFVMNNFASQFPQPCEESLAESKNLNVFLNRSWGKQVCTEHAGSSSVSDTFGAVAQHWSLRTEFW